MTDGTATVGAESVTITWTHSQQQDGIPVSSFTVVGGRINPPTSPPTIDVMAAADMFQVILNLDMLDPGTDYRVTIRAVNLLGESEGRDVPFRTPRRTYVDCLAQ